MTPEILENLLLLIEIATDRRDRQDRGWEMSVIEDTLRKLVELEQPKDG